MPPNRATPLLRVLAGPSAGRAFPVANGRATIGRGEEADLQLDDGKASKVHAAVALVGDGWRLEDLGSRNGTLVGGAKIAEPTPLEPGDRFRVGLTELEFAFADPQGLRLRGPDGVEWPLTGERLVIGRAGGGADLSLPDDKASREHALLTHDDGGWTVADNRSRNGTWVNDARLEVDRLARLRPGDRLRIGRIELTVVGPAPTTATPPPVERPARPHDRPSTGTVRAIRRERPPTEVIDARAIARDIGLTGMVLKGVIVLAVVLVVVLIVVPALDRQLNGEPPAADASVRVGKRGEAVAPAPRPVAAAPVVAPEPEPEPAEVAAPPPDAPAEPAPAPRVRAPAPEAAAVPEAPPPTADARAPVYAPRLVAATYLPAAVAAVEITPKGTIIARGDGYVAVYEAGCVSGTLEALESPVAATADADEFALRLEGGVWRFANRDGRPAVQAGAQRWWAEADVAPADAARVIDAWSASDGLVGLAFRCAGPDSLAARDPRAAARPLIALTHGWTPTLSGPGMLYLVADPAGTPRAATYVAGDEPAHAVDAWGRVYLPRRLADPTDTVGLGGSVGVTALSADLRRVALALDAGALTPGEAGEEAFAAVALRDGVLVLGGRTSGRRLAVTGNALRKQPVDAGASGLLVVLRLW